LVAGIQLLLDLREAKAAHNRRLGKSWAGRIWAKQYIFNEQKNMG